MIRRKLKSLGFALTGITIAWREEFNFRFEILCAAGTLATGWYFAITSMEWMLVVAMIGGVLTAESFNTALEEFCDMVKGDPDPHIAKIKDLAAAAVLIATIAAFVVGCIIFIPHIIALFS